jgi:TolB-like protein/tetratricopeptide (TPR) repeat protein
MSTSARHVIFRFRDFELDAAAYELRRKGRRIRLARQPMDLLLLLLERRRELVSRDDIAKQLWARDVFVDVDAGIHTAILRIRQALGDSRDSPLFVETVSGKGYRFVAPVEVVSAQNLRPSPTTLAVLPFEWLGGDRDREYVANGLTEDTIASLGRIAPDHLSVLGRASTLAYRETSKSLADIGDQLGVDYVVEGTIRSEAGVFRITSKLIRAKDQVQVWSAAYDREPSSLIGLQRELSTAIAESIRLRFSAAGVETLGRRHSENAEAHDLYLRGRNFANQRTPAANQRAVAYYERAAALDPNYGLVWAALADVKAASPINGDAPPLEVWAHARDAADRAVRANPDLAEAWLAQGMVQMMLDWDWPAAEAALGRAIALNPSLVGAHLLLGHTLSQDGRHEEAFPLMSRGCELDPLEPMTHAMASQVAFQARDHVSALAHARRAIAIDPEFWIGYMMAGQAYEQLGQRDRSLEAFTQAARFSGANSKPLSTRAYLLATTERREEATEVLSTLQSLSRDRYVPPYAIALVHAGLGDRDAAFDWLRRGFTVRDVHLIFLTVDPKWDAYRSDSRFTALLSDCGFVRNRATLAPQQGHDRRL